jgi:hypothetical protein
MLSDFLTTVTLRRIYIFFFTGIDFYFQWDDEDVHFVLDQHALLDFNSASSLKQQSAGRHVAPFGHIILIPSQPYLFKWHRDGQSCTSICR